MRARRRTSLTTNTYFIAPSLRYRPDLDTNFTVIASASTDQTKVRNFLPYVGTVVDAPFGRIPTHLFASDPSTDYFKREQEMIGRRLPTAKPQPYRHPRG